MEKSSVKKNFIYQMIYELFVLVLPFITSPYIARVIGPEGLGTYSYFYSISYYFVIFSMLGLKNYGNRTIARIRENQIERNKQFSSILGIHVMISVMCFMIYAVYVLGLRENKIYAFIQGAYVLSALFDISWFYFGIEKFKLTVARDTVIKVLTVVSVFMFVRTADDLWKYFVIMSGSILLSQLILWIPLKKYVSFIKPTWNEMIVHLKPLLILFIPTIAVSLYKYMDKIMIGAISGKTQLGFYENAEKVVNIPMTVIASFGTVMLPKMSNLVAKDDKNIALRYIDLSMQMVMCLAYGLAFGLAAVGRVFAPLFWGEQFKVSGFLIMGLSITIPFVAFANVIRTQYLIPNSRDKEFIISVISGAIINLIINGLLIPRYGAIGAMVGTIFAEISVCIVQICFVLKSLPINKYIRLSVPFLFVGCIMFGLVYGLGTVGGGGVLILLLQVCLGGSVYLLISAIYFYVKKNEIFMSLLEKIYKKH